MQIKCGDETRHGSDQAAQNRWNMMIDTALTPPADPARDGVPLQARPLDAARAAGALIWRAGRPRSRRVTRACPRWCPRRA